MARGLPVRVASVLGENLALVGALLGVQQAVVLSCVLAASLSHVVCGIYEAERKTETLLVPTVRAWTFALLFVVHYTSAGPGAKASLSVLAIGLQRLLLKATERSVALNVIGAQE